MTWQARALRLMAWLKGFRYVKFGLVGASGTVVNLAVLYVAHEHLFRSIEPEGSKPYASLALAIAVATVNNFTWNRLWTWSDRLRQVAPLQPGVAASPVFYVLLGQLGRYTLASWFGIALQYGLTLWLSQTLHYMVANVIAIVIASVSNFMANDRWTFNRRTPR